MKKILLFLSIIALITVAASAAGVVRGKDSPPEESQDGGFRPLEKFCSQYWGVMTGDGAYCRFEQTFHFNRTHVGASLFVTSVPVVVGDRLSVTATESAMPVVGSQEYAARSFVAKSEGYLSFRPLSAQGLFSVKRVNLRRCFIDSGGSIETAVCPE